MKKVLLMAMLAVFSLPVFAGTKMVFGTIDQLKGEKNIPVTLNWKEAVYAKGGDLDDFLLKAERNENWESQSLSYFLREVNDKVGEYGIRVVSADKGDNPKFRIEIVTQTISKGGDITGEILLLPAEGNDPIASISFSSDESDDNDKIAFRDQLESIGESFGKLLKKQIKQASKK